MTTYKDICRYHYLREWRNKNPHKIKSYTEEYKDKAKEYIKANPDVKKRANSKWWKSNKEKARLYAAQRNARKKANGIFQVTEKDWLKLVVRYRYRCAYCDKKSKLTMDHIIPLSKGGRHSIGNILPACGKCNSSKGNKLLVEFRHLEII